MPDLAGTYTFTPAPRVRVAFVHRTSVGAGGGFVTTVWYITADELRTRAQLPGQRVTGSPRAADRPRAGRSYSVQRRAYLTWELLHTDPRAALTTDAVRHGVMTLVRHEHPAYAQLWSSLTQIEKRVLKAVIVERVFPLS